MKKLIIHIMILPVENHPTPKQVQNGHVRIKKGRWLGVFIWDGVGLKVPTQVLNFPPVAKEGAPWLSYQLVQMWGRRGGGRDEI